MAAADDGEGDAAPTVGATAPVAPPARAPRRILVTTLVVLASLLAFVGIFAVWANRQALNTDNWATTSSQLLEDPAIRSALSTYLVDQVYAAYDVPAELRQALPRRAKPLAGPAASGLQDLAQKGVDELLQRPRVQALWEDANRRAHARLMLVLEGGDGALSTSNGTVVLDVGTLLQQTAGRIGVGGRAADRIPPGAGEITILRSQQLATAQDAVDILRKLPVILIVLALVLYAAAIAFAGRRREALRSAGIGLAAAGVAALVARGLAGREIVDALAKTAAAQPPVESVWRIGTSQLVIAAQATVAYGLVAVLAAWLAGPTHAAVATRRWAAPYLRDARYAYGALAALLLLLIAWGPTPATRNVVTLLLFAGLLALGLAALRRQTAREHPGASLEQAAERRRARLDRIRAAATRTGERVQARRSAHEGPEPPQAAAVEATVRMDALERLGRLRDQGVLDEQEFAAEKQRLLLDA